MEWSRRPKSFVEFQLRASPEATRTKTVDHVIVVVVIWGKVLHDNNLHIYDYIETTFIKLMVKLVLQTRLDL